MQKQIVSTKFLIFTGAIFFLVWAAYDFFIYPATLTLFSEVTCVLIKNFFKILIWVLIPFYLLKTKYDLSVYVSSNSIFSGKIHWKGFFLTVFCLLLYNVTIVWLTTGTLKIGNNLTLSAFLNSVLFVVLQKKCYFVGGF